MHPHHASTISAAIAHFSPDPSVLALLLSGSIAHGFESADSDVDLLVILTEEAYAERQQSGQLTLFSRELATYTDGYIDAKYISLSFIRDVADRGSEPARFAFEGARVLFSRLEEGVLEEALERVVRYPVEGKVEKVKRFRAQLEAWEWFYLEGKKKGNEYLMGLAVRKLVLFGGRLILAHNEVLYPFHKWFLRVLEGVVEKPKGLMECIGRVLSEPSDGNVQELYDMVKNFREWEENPNGWGAQFMLDNELTWMSGNTPVDDL
ncbi:hypothetical protein VTI74DRAFT_3488 [Chaetomium olivicolor]